MTAPDWDRVKSLFHQALNQQPGERTSFLDRACGDDRTLREEVAALLDADDQHPSFLHNATIRPHFEEATQHESLDLSSSMDAQPGECVAAYRLIRPIASGGMGVVWLAERADGQFQQRLAIKLLKAGLSSAAVIERFRHERQVLAQLEHPYIARLLDGGTTESGQPFLAMEYIAGLPIDRYCHEHRLDVPARLQLFESVCSAVRFAHQHLVVHRDLKPANILVTGDGTPKLLDFGIAKIVSEDNVEATRLTLSGQRLLTPRYASPEQVRGRAITTATDVYSLGVILYELLTGVVPYRVADDSLSAWERAVLETDPVLPSQAVTSGGGPPAGPDTGMTPSAVPLPAETSTSKHQWSRSLKGDLDNILLVAMRKDPARRYPSVEHLMDDLRRYREQKPVRARPDTWLYRSTKWVRRNRRVAVLLALLLLVLVISGSLLARQARLLRVERDAAWTAEAGTSRLNEYYRQWIGDLITSRNLVTPTEWQDKWKMFVKTARQELNSYPEQLADVLESIGQGYAAISDFEEASQLFAEATKLRESLPQPSPAALAWNLNHLASSQGNLGRYEESLHTIERALSLLGTVADIDPIKRAYCLQTHANILMRLNRGEDAEQSFRRALESYQQASTREDMVSLTYRYGIARSLVQQGNYAVATPIFDQVIAEMERLLGPGDRRVLSTRIDVAYMLVSTTKFDDARRIALRLAESMNATGIVASPAAASLVISCTRLLISVNEHVVARQLLETAVPGLRNAESSQQADLVLALIQWSSCLMMDRDVPAALECANEARDICQRRSDFSQQLKCTADLQVAHVLSAMSRNQEAESLARACLSYFRPAGVPIGQEGIMAMDLLSRILLNMQRMSEARPLIEELIRVSPRVPGCEIMEADAWACLALCDQDAGEIDQAIVSAKRAVDLHRSFPSMNRFKLAYCLEILSDLHAAAADPSAAESAASEALELWDMEGERWMDRATLCRLRLGQTLFVQGKTEKASVVLAKSARELAALLGVRDVIPTDAGLMDPQRQADSPVSFRDQYPDSTVQPHHLHEAWSSLADALQSLGRVDEADVYLDRCRELRSRFPEIDRATKSNTAQENSLP